MSSESGLKPNIAAEKCLTFEINDVSHVEPCENLRHQYHTQHDLCDLHIICCDGSIKGHSSIVYPNSPRFSAYMSEGTVNQMKYVLDYFYYGKISIPWRLDTIYFLQREFVHFRPQASICETLKLFAAKLLAKRKKNDTSNKLSVTIGKSGPSKSTTHCILEKKLSTDALTHVDSNNKGSQFMQQTIAHVKSTSPATSVQPDRPSPTDVAMETSDSVSSSSNDCYTEGYNDPAFIAQRDKVMANCLRPTPRSSLPEADCNADSKNDINLRSAIEALKETRSTTEKSSVTINPSDVEAAQRAKSRDPTIATQMHRKSTSGLRTVNILPSSQRPSSSECSTQTCKFSTSPPDRSSSPQKSTLPPAKTISPKIIREADLSITIPSTQSIDSSKKLPSPSDAMSKSDAVSSSATPSTAGHSDPPSNAKKNLTISNKSSDKETASSVDQVCAIDPSTKLNNGKTGVQPDPAPSAPSVDREKATNCDVYPKNRPVIPKPNDSNPLDTSLSPSKGPLVCCKNCGRSYSLNIQLRKHLRTCGKEGSSAELNSTDNESINSQSPCKNQGKDTQVTEKTTTSTEERESPPPEMPVETFTPTDVSKNVSKTPSPSLSLICPSSPVKNTTREKEKEKNRPSSFPESSRNPSKSHSLSHNEVSSSLQRSKLVDKSQNSRHSEPSRSSSSKSRSRSPITSSSNKPQERRRRKRDTHRWESVEDAHRKESLEVSHRRESLEGSHRRQSLEGSHRRESVEDPHREEGGTGTARRGSVEEVQPEASNDRPKKQPKLGALRSPDSEPSKKRKGGPLMHKARQQARDIKNNQNTAACWKTKQDTTGRRAASPNADDTRPSKHPRIEGPSSGSISSKRAASYQEQEAKRKKAIEEARNKSTTG